MVSAHLIPELAEQLQAYLLYPQIAYLTAEHFAPTPFARAHRVLEYFPFSRKRLFSHLRATEAGTITVKKRGVQNLPEEIVREWKPVGRKAVTVFLYRADAGVMAVLAEDA